jgi:Uma2 family endonuclease
MEILKKKITWQEFRQMEFDDSDDAWYELINGELVRKQSPTIRHQRISRKIETLLNVYATQSGSGEMFHAPLDVVLDDNNTYHPDILYIKNERKFIIDNKEEVIIGAPDLVIEILSKSTAGDDRGAKKDNYEKYGVREYWLVDPKNNSVEVYTLENQRYKMVSYVVESGIAKSTILEGFELEIEPVFED